MAAVCSAGDWLVFSSSHNLISVNIKHHREPFVFDCSKAPPRPEEPQSDTKSDGGEAQPEGSDQILAVASSASGNYVALTDDHKRLVLFRTRPWWERVSTRWLVRRCTSVVFSQAEDELFVADKSGDVYSFSVLEPQKGGELKLGHLSMLLGIALSPDDAYVITADRDEKIRVSRRTSPYDIQAFCLGHTEFVSALCVPAGHPEWLLSGSGDGTVNVWQYETGRRLQSFDLHEFGFGTSQGPDAEPDQTLRFAVSRVVASPDGRHVVVQCESFPALQVFALDGERLTRTEKLVLPHDPCDVTFDPQNVLWVLLEDEDTRVLRYTHEDGRWQRESENAELKRVSETLHTHRELLKGSAGTGSRFSHLYKVNFDNMASYLQKKNERIQQQSQKGSRKRADGGGAEPNGATKRSKRGNKATAEPQTCDTES